MDGCLKKPQQRRLREDDEWEEEEKPILDGVAFNPRLFVVERAKEEKQKFDRVKNLS